jgi:cytidylate kinase
MGVANCLKEFDMNLQNPSAYLATALIKASEYSRPPRLGMRRESGSFGPPVSAFTIAVSREVGARGPAVAREVGRRLGWPVYDHELLEQIAKEMHVSVHLLESVDEKPGSWLQECIESLAAVPTVTEISYFRRLLKMLLSLGAHGGCVIVGRGAAQVLPPETTLRVRLLATLADRIAVISRERGLSQHEASLYVESQDRERIRFIKAHFQKDPSDPQNYDLILNSSRLSVAACADQIVDALHRLQACPAKPSVAELSAV